MRSKQNLLEALPGPLAEELFETLQAGGGFRLERIVSQGHATPPGQWYDQDQAEWVLLLSGAARLRFQDVGELVQLRPGDSLNIPAHCRHRVEWTEPGCQTVWLALHYT